MKKPKSVEEVADELLDLNGPAAIVGEEWLRPAEAGESTYNIDDTPNGKMAIIDSIPSQANRIEPLFRKSPYDELVPQITIKAGEEQRNLLEVGHRAADAFVRYHLHPARRQGLACSGRGLAGGDNGPISAADEHDAAQLLRRGGLREGGSNSTPSDTCLRPGQ
jgi:hypothetical protein